MLASQLKNPNLTHFKTTINKMSQTLCKSVAIDILRILKLFKAAQQENFKGLIPDVVGIEKNANVLISSIVKMLNVSKELAINLNTRSDELNESAMNLEKSAAQQVEFLTNIAGVVEQIDEKIGELKESTQTNLDISLATSNISHSISKIANEILDDINKNKI
ncbi:hypothetical protein ACLQ6A_001853 [Campylobacter jejuni]